MNGQPFFLSRNSFRTVTGAFYQAIDNRDTEMFRTLNSFLYNQLSESFEHNNEAAFDDFSTMFPYYYEYALGKLNSSITYKGIYDLCADRAIRGIKEKTSFGMRFRLDDETIPIEEKKRINRFAKIMLNRFSEIINICLRNKDLLQLPFILNQLHQISGSYNSRLTNAKHSIQFKKSQNPKGEALKELIEIEQGYAVDSFIENTVRLIFKVTLFWSFFLFDRGVLSSDELQKINTEFETYKGYIESDFIEDLLALRSGRYETDFSWNRWDYKPRLDGVVYSPPDVQFWATSGAILYILRSKASINFQLDNKSAGEINSHEYLVSSMQEILQHMPERGFEKFSKILGSTDEADFMQRIEQLRARLEALKATTITNKEEQISNIHLDPEYVNSFKLIITEGWEKGNTLREVFSYFEQVVPIADDDEDMNKELYVVGNKKQLWQGYKTCLIRSEDYYVPIFGMERVGQQMADTEENSFFGTLITGKRNSASNIFSGVEESINSILKQGFKPSLIMMGQDNWHSHFSELKSDDFVFDWNDKKGFPFSDFGGLYKNIPIVKFRSDLLRNVVVVSDFKESFILQQKIQPEAFRDILVANVSEISADDADAIIAENEAYWKNNLTQEQARMKLMNSIKADFYLEEAFDILNEDAYSLIVMDK